MRVKIYRKIIRPIVNGIPYSILDWHDDTEEMRESIRELCSSETLEWEEKYIECGEIERGGAWG